ncbi:endoplasmic reticulum resident protein 44-like [Lethenteron reissneri]|uniref:endoplasmic reticulum resident protein 44-like n=1 Tax=Lethenteron reissneri TaxID=7753 RepID=UPI002AB660E0|nr:endoplasmic reticulum resident protein 44-like [Lethenteron reissneri]XP_061432652.1 endoplasmic reticulum resident protein 44-like [Lethenteron reissneri]
MDAASAHTERTLAPLLLLAATWISQVLGSTVNLNTENVDSILGSADLVMVNFYADWCRFSQMLHPVFDEAAHMVQQEFPGDNSIVFARVDCELQAELAQRYRISKYPTMKVFKSGRMMRREFRGQRSAAALADFVRQQTLDPVLRLETLDQLDDIDRSKRTIVGYFEEQEGENYRTFLRVAHVLREDCVFYAAFGDISKPERFSGDNIIYRPAGEKNPDMVFLGTLKNQELLFAWTQDKCVPLVREITFENGEELTEEGLPFLILFHNREDEETLSRFQLEVARQLISEKGSINFLHADCEKFRHPLQHINKSPKDCPVIAIDSFKHMYVFPNVNDMMVPGKLRQFVLDLHSGKLHREFHHGPDPTQVVEEQFLVESSDPPESSFQKLAPSDRRYTILKRDRDEL